MKALFRVTYLNKSDDLTMDYVKIQEIPVELLVEHPENSNFMNAETARKLRLHIAGVGKDFSYLCIR